MLVSHRWHTPPLEGVRLELDRVVFDSWVLRRASVDVVVQDERLTTTVIGRGAPQGRSRLLVALHGTTTLFAEGRTLEVAPGDAVVVRDLGRVTTRANPGYAFEIDWNPDGPLASGAAPQLDWARLGRETVLAIEALCRCMRTVRPENRECLVPEAERALRALRAEGLPLSADGLGDPVSRGTDEALQRLIDAFDAELSQLERGPALSTVEARLGWSRRTVARRAKEANLRYGVSALSGPDWRSARDFYRLLLGTIFASHEDATTARLATMLGYGSPVALCHAFAHAGLPSPASVGARARTG